MRRLDAPRGLEEPLWEGTRAMLALRKRSREQGPPESAGRAALSFAEFLPHWTFKNRETGELRTFAELWEGQQRFSEAADEHDRVIALKAGKLGFTEVECAFDAWRAVFGPAGRVHLFSKGQRESFSLLDYVREGIERLPAEWGVRIASDERGGDTSSQMVLVTPWDPPGVKRTVVSYPASPRISIDQTCIHAHVDELAAMVHADGVMDAVMSTISPYGGTVHIVSRGHGPDDRMARMWEAAQAGSEFHPVFAPWWMRPDRDDDWYRQLEESGEFTPLGLRYYAPVTPEDALAGEGENVFVPLESWDRLADGKGPIVDRTPAVMALDAGVSSDCFAVVVVTRYDDAPETDVDVRAVRIWRPEGGQVNFSEVEQWVRDYCREHNVVVCTYDPHELHDMAQRLTHDQVTWMDPFPQTEQRLRADAMLRNMIMQGRLHHSGDPALREHIANARAKTYGEEDDSRIRIIKGSPEKKVDGAVASSMATYQCMRLNLA